MTTIKRPRKFKGPKAEYIIVNGERVMLDEAVIADWDNIDTLTLDTMTFDRRQPAADGSEADKVEADGFVHETWSKTIVADYVSVNDIVRETKIEEAKAERDFVRVKIERKYQLTEEKMKQLEETI